MPQPVNAADVRIEPWTEADLDLLLRQNAPEMTVHLGGPESEEAVLARHRRYLALNDRDDGQVFRIVHAPSGEAVGGICLWESDWQDEPAWETGWAVLPEHQGRGIATIAVMQVLAYARGQRRFPAVVAFPGVENVASNAVCRKAGFTKVGEGDFEYPKGSFMRCAIWRFPLRDPDNAGS